MDNILCLIIRQHIMMSVCLYYDYMTHVLFFMFSSMYVLYFQILSLRESISNLVISLVEENGPGKSQVAMV